MSSQTYYVDVYANINILSGDKIHVGMFLIKDNYVMLTINFGKFEGIERLFSQDSFLLFSSVINSLYNKFQLDILYIPNSAVYFQNISNYCNNIVAFSKPFPIDIEFTYGNLLRLHDSYYKKIEQ